MKIRYTANPTAMRFHADDSFIRAVKGPFASGKSVMCIMEAWRRSQEVPPDLMNRRRSRWAIIRNTYRELKDTTIRTFFEWLPEEMGEYRRSEECFYVNLPHPAGDGTQIMAEFLFRALDTEADAKKLLSLELTGAFINEAREIRYKVFTDVQGRVFRYPKKGDYGLGPDDPLPYWSGVILDTNPPDTDSWFYDTFEVLRPEGHKIFHQPSGFSPHPDNIEHLDPDYYRRLAQGKQPAWIKAYIHGEYSFLATGRPVYPEYNDNNHVSVQANYDPNNGPVILGADFGLTPATTLSQLTSSGQWITFDEVTFDRADATQMAEEVSRRLNQLKPLALTGFSPTPLTVVGYGDPSGASPTQTDSNTVNLIFNQAGIPMTPAIEFDDGLARQQALRNRLTRNIITGQPSFQLHPRCTLLRKGLGGGYHYRKVQLAGTDRYALKPEKDRFSHVVESLEYGMLGHGEGFSQVPAPHNLTQITVARSARRSQGNARGRSR